METLNHVLAIVQSAAIPLLAVVMAVVVINIMKGFGKDRVQEEESFKVTESSFWLVIAAFGVLSGLILIWMAGSNERAGQSVAAYVMAIICFLITVVTLYIYKKRHLSVEGETLIYQPIWGKKESYGVKTVGKIERVESPRCIEYRFYNRSGKKLFEIQGYMVNSRALIRYMRKYPIKMTRVEVDK